MDTIINIYIGFFQKIWEFIKWVSGYSLALGIVLFLIIISILKMLFNKYKN